MGVEDRAPDPIAGGLDAEPQANTPYLAPGGAQTAREDEEASPATRGGQRQRLRATRANEVWAVDFQFDETSDRRRIKLCNIVDEYTREALAIRVGRSCTADDVVGVIAELIVERGVPAYLRSDNGPEFIAWALRDYCRMTLMATSYIEPGSPWENPFVESFNGRLLGRRLWRRGRVPRALLACWGNVRGDEQSDGPGVPSEYARYTKNRIDLWLGASLVGSTAGVCI